MTDTVAPPALSVERGSVEIEIGPELGPDGKPTGAGWRWIGRKLREPMPVRSFKGPGGREISFISARQVAKRLDDIVNPGNWSDRYKVLTTEPWIIECTLGVFGVEKTDCGYSNAPDADPEDRNYETEPAKAAYSDAFKRAAVKHGIGRFLYPEMRSN